MEHLGRVELKATRGSEAFPDYLGMWYKKKAYGVKRGMTDLPGLQGPTAPRDLLVLPVYKVYLVNLGSLARGGRKVKVDYLEWTASLDLLVLRVHKGHQESRDTLDLLVFLVKLDFQGSLENPGSLVFLVKMVWMVFLEMTVPWVPGESVEQMVFLANLDPRVTTGLQDPEDLRGREDKLVPLDSLV